MRPPEKAGVLTKDDIVAERVVEGYSDDEGFSPAAYDLRVGHIITPHEYLRWDGQGGRDIQGHRKDCLFLKPGETASLASLEEIKLKDKSINALIVPRNRFAQRGVLMLNAGHVDPGHEGFVMAQVVNLTDRPFPVQLLDRYFSIVFFYLSGPGENRPQMPGTAQRIRDMRTDAAQLPVSLVQKEALAEVFVARKDLTFELVKRAWVLLAALAVLAGAGVGIWQAVAAAG